MLLVLEESHNFCPQVGVAASSKILRTIASEGRKFGLGLLIVTQRAAKVDKNVLSQCNTQIILKITNPNDLKAISSSVEGLTSAMEEEVQRLPIGVAIVTGGGIQMPLMVEIRPRETRHGGESVKVLPD
jgi:DNA helicase HerA-like ATPase